MSSEFDAISRSKENRRLTQSHRSNYARLREMYIGHLQNLKIAQKEISPKDLFAIKEKIRVDFRKNQRLSLLTTSLLSFAILIILGYIIFFIIEEFMA